MFLPRREKGKKKKDMETLYRRGRKGRRANSHAIRPGEGEGPEVSSLVEKRKKRRQRTYDIPANDGGREKGKWIHDLCVIGCPKKTHKGSWR